VEHSYTPESPFLPIYAQIDSVFPLHCDSAMFQLLYFGDLVNVANRLGAFPSLVMIEML